VVALVGRSGAGKTTVTDLVRFGKLHNELVSIGAPRGVFDLSVGRIIAAVLLCL